jgi:hypothetical protein
MILNTCGDGYWSNEQRGVRITDMELRDDSCELRVYFNTEDWDVKQLGLIYTDSQFLIELKQLLRDNMLSDDVEYSEQGMQGVDYVSLDVSDDFVVAWYRPVSEFANVPTSSHV